MKYVICVGGRPLVVSSYDGGIIPSISFPTPRTVVVSAAPDGEIASVTLVGLTADDVKGAFISSNGCSRTGRSGARASPGKEETGL